MKHLGISGGGTKIAGLFGVAESILYERNYRPDIISGISAGALLSLPLALNKREEIKELVLNIELDTSFSVPPVKPGGKIRLWNAIIKLITGKHYLGVQQNLESLLRRVVTEEEFTRYQEDDSLPACLVASVDFYTGKRFYINLKTVSYEDFPRFVNASASLPVYTPGVAFNKTITDFEGVSSTNDKLLLYDGGVRDHSPSAKILASSHPKFAVTETCTIFSRPEEISQILDPGDFTPKNILKVLERFVDITTAEISKNDAYQEQEIITQKGIIDHGTFYLPKIMKGTYDVDKARIRLLYERSRELVNDQTWKNPTGKNNK